MRFEPLEGLTFGARVTDVALKSIDAAEFAEIYRGWLEYGLLIFPDQHLTNEQQVAFAKRFGGLEFEITPISNVRADGTVRPLDKDDMVLKTLIGNMEWHADSTYMPIQAKGAVFSAHVTPTSGGETGWADMRAAYDALDAATREKVDSLSAHHSIRYSMGRNEERRAAAGDPLSGGKTYVGYGMDVAGAPLRPLVKVHPETGRRTLAIGRHAHDIPGWTHEESEAFLDGLTEFACQAPRIYHHTWAPGDVVCWDNRCLMHRAMMWDLTQPRVMYHSRLAGHPLTEYAAAA